jgi:hypothetical protein
MRLIWQGAPNQWRAGWPASDHEDADASRAADKIASGLYRPAEAAELDELPLSRRRRPELNAIAAAAGVESPESLPTKRAVGQAIEAASRED